MSLEITADAARKDEATVVNGTRAYNQTQTPKDVESLCIFDRLDSGEIVGGLTGKTFWNYLEIAYLWVDEAYRMQGRARAIMIAAENEALKRGCHNVLLDTYSFQALAFYKGLGYVEFGEIDDFSGEHTRYYLRKRLSPPSGDSGVVERVD
ncbi:GNAT family N-acetyltransferase [Verrucomicrobiaceae bacterium 227]